MWSDFNACMDEVLRASDPARAAPVSADGEHLRYIRPETLMRRACDMSSEDAARFQSLYAKIRGEPSSRDVIIASEPLLRLLQDRPLAEMLYEVVAAHLQHAEQLNVYLEDAKLFRAQKPGATADDLLAYFNRKQLK